MSFLTPGSEFVLGLDATTVVRVGYTAFHVYEGGARAAERGTSGRLHVLELFHIDDSWQCWLDGQAQETSGILGIWDLLDLTIGESRSYEQEEL